MYLFIRVNTPNGEKVVVIPDNRVYSIVRTNAQIIIRYDNCSFNIEGDIDTGICSIPKADTLTIFYPSAKIADSVLSSFFKALESGKKSFSFRYDKMGKTSIVSFGGDNE